MFTQLSCALSNCICQILKIDYASMRLIYYDRLGGQVITTFAYEFKSQARQTRVIKIGSNSSDAKRSLARVHETDLKNGCSGHSR